MTSLSNTLHMERSKGLQSGELGGQISCDQWFSMLAFSQFWVTLAVWARKALAHLQKVCALPAYFVAKNGLLTLHHTRDGQLSKECRKQFL
jgi:hypothetical protein